MSHNTQSSGPQHSSRPFTGLLLIALLGLGASWLPISNGRSARAADGAQTAFSLAYVPRDAVLVAAVRPAALLDRPALAPLAALIADDDELPKQLGISPSKIETATMVFLPQPPDNVHSEPAFAGAIVRTIDKASARQLAQHHLSEPVKETYAGQDYFQSSAGGRRNGNLCFLPGRHVVAYAPARFWRTKLSADG